MNSPYRPVSYGPIAYILVVMAMVVGFFVTFQLVSPLVDAAGGLIQGLLGEVTRAIGL